MKKTLSYIGTTLIAGMLIVVPAYLAILLLLKAMKTVGKLIRPIAGLIPGSIPAEPLLSLLLVLGICFVIGYATGTQAGKLMREKMVKLSSKESRDTLSFGASPNSWQDRPRRIYKRILEVMELSSASPQLFFSMYLAFGA